MKIFSFLCVLIFFSCQERKLPILGLRHIENGDTIYVKTPDFSCQNQFNELIERKHLEGKIHISNFFFTSCATICPKTIRSMIKIGNHFKSNNEIHYINFSIDYRKDSVGRLKTYFDKLQIDVPNFQLLHISTMEEVKRISENYMSIAVEDPSAQGGFDHSGWILLADKNQYLRSYCLGTDEKDVDRFIKDVQKLLDEE
ncbi:MAG: SCO family protein [Saprospiraceae bacterium]|nr:SCO family protein [Saprospiraceae bacterium]MBK9728637.1 SCO family protein [Saprospiraceae bacterium]